MFLPKTLKKWYFGGPKMTILGPILDPLLGPPVSHFPLGLLGFEAQKRGQKRGQKGVKKGSKSGHFGVPDPEWVKKGSQK